MTIQKIIKDWEKLCDNDSELNSVRRQVATILKDSLTLMLDGARKRHFDEFIILADDCEKKGWSFDKFIRYMLLINDKDKLKEVLDSFKQ